MFLVLCSTVAQNEEVKTTNIYFFFFLSYHIFRENNLTARQQCVHQTNSAQSLIIIIRTHFCKSCTQMLKDISTPFRSASLNQLFIY